MSLLARTSNGNTATTPTRYTTRDPFQLAARPVAWDPFFGGRQVSAFVPAFEVKETNEAFILKADVPVSSNPSSISQSTQHPHDLRNAGRRGAQGGR